MPEDRAAERPDGDGDDADASRPGATSRRAAAATLAQWLGLGAAIGVACGAASALFLTLLALATDTREGHEALVFALPLAGLVLGWIYERLGQPVVAGTGLVLDTIHDDGPELPTRLAPLVLIGTVLTHLFGGSAGREGTAVQMGAGLSDWIAHRLRLSGLARRHLLVAGVAGGFGSVFGTPIAGAVFGMEFLVLGQLEVRALVPALVAAVVGDLTTRALGVGHAAYPTVAALPLSPLLLGKWLLFAGAIALTTTAFIELTHRIRDGAKRWLPRLPLRMALGGAALVALWQLLGTSDYLGLGVPVILRTFSDPDVASYAFALKLGFTAITIGVGFLGGEVTPLFFIGAALGATLAPVLDLPLAMCAGVGMTAALASAANTPLALSIMAVELLGAHVLPHVVIVSALAYLFTGHRSIYPAQRLLHGKTGGAQTRATPLRDLSRGQPPRGECPAPVSPRRPPPRAGRRR